MCYRYKASNQENAKYETVYAEFEVNPDTNNSKNNIINFPLINHPFLYKLFS